MSGRYLVPVHTGTCMGSPVAGFRFVSYRCHIGMRSRDGLVGYDAALTQLRSGVRFPFFVRFFFFPGTPTIMTRLL